jgi:thiamine-phosphate pyrophosphorylase
MVTPAILPEHVPALVATIGAAASAGVDLVQVRQPALDTRTLVAVVRGALEAVQGTRARVLVNERLDVALAAGAHGVHLKEDSMPAARLRAAAPRGLLIGRSVHSVDAVRRADVETLDYLVFGTVFETPSKPGREAAGADALAAAVRETRLPVLAIGGMTLGRLAPVSRAGAAGIAAIRLFADHADRAVTDVRRLWPAS